MMKVFTGSVELRKSEKPDGVDVMSVSWVSARAEILHSMRSTFGEREASALAVFRAIDVHPAPLSTPVKRIIEVLVSPFSPCSLTAKLRIAFVTSLFTPNEISR